MTATLPTISKNTWDDLTPWERHTLVLKEQARLASGRRRGQTGADEKMLLSLGILLANSRQYVGDFRLPYRVDGHLSIHRFVDEQTVEPIETAWIDERVEALDGE